MITFVLIFMVTLFIYIHLHHHLYKNNILKCHDIVFTTIDNLNEVCDIRQPIMFTYPFQEIKEYEYKQSVYMKPVGKRESILVDHTKIQTLLKQSYVSEENQLEYNIIQRFKQLYDVFRPPFTIRSEYDLWMGNKDSYTLLRYHLDYRTFIIVEDGEIQIQLFPPNMDAILMVQTDYIHMTNTSLLNPQKTNHKCIEKTMKKGDVMYIPAYWIFSIQYKKDNTKLAVCKYMTCMNIISILPFLSLSLIYKCKSYKPIT